MFFFWSVANLGAHIYLPTTAFYMLRFINRNRIVIHRQNMYVSFVFCCILVYSYLRIFPDTPHNMAFIGSYCYMLLGLLGAQHFNTRSLEKREKILRVIFLIVLFAIFAEQATFILGLGVLDLHQLITINAYESRSNNLILPMLTRPTAFFAEPTNFSINLLSLGVISYSIGSKRYARLFFLLPTLTFSVAGTCLGLISIIISLLNDKPHKLFCRRNVLVFFIMTLLAAILIYLLSLINFGYNAIAYRLYIFQTLPNFTINDYIFGQGYTFVNGGRHILGFNLLNSHTKEAGFIINSLFSLGIFSLPLFFYIIYLLRPHGIVVILLTFTTLMSKIDFNFAIFWLLLFVLVGSRQPEIQPLKKTRFEK